MWRSLRSSTPSRQPSLCVYPEEIPGPSGERDCFFGYLLQFSALSGSVAKGWFPKRGFGRRAFSPKAGVKVWESPNQPEESFGPRGVPESVRQGVPENGDVRGSVPRGVSGARRAAECQKGVARVSKRCPDTSGTLSGHLFDTSEPGARKAPETPCRTLSGTPRARRARMTLLAGRGFPK